MKRLLIVVVCVVAAVSITAVAQDYDYTIAPWQYGVLVWVQTPSVGQQQFIGEAGQAVQDVFSFWDLPVPVPAINWATPEQTSSQAYDAAWQAMFTQSPSQVMQLLDGYTPPFAYPMQGKLGSPFPISHSDDLLLLPYPTWSGGKIEILTLGVFPSFESMNRLFRDYTFSGFFGGVGGYTVMHAEETWAENEYTIIKLFPNIENIIMSIQGNMQFLLLHELAHWASWLWCEEHGVDLYSLPRPITEGFADYTAHSLVDDDRWRTIAASWAQQGGDLTDVPRPLIYEVGTSIVSLLVQEKGKDGLLKMLADPTVDWVQVISSLNAAWRRSLAHVRFSAGDPARYEAVLEDLALCRHLLAPVLTSEAGEIVTRLYDGRGTMEDIDRFWNIVSQIPPEPSEDVWQALIARIPSFLIVQSRDSDPDIRMVRARLQVKLEKYADNHDWEIFYPTFIEALREVVAHYGTLQSADSEK